jgi:hypothetical protein
MQVKQPLTQYLGNQSRSKTGHSPLSLLVFLLAFTSLPCPATGGNEQAGSTRSFVATTQTLDTGVTMLHDPQDIEDESDANQAMLDIAFAFHGSRLVAELTMQLTGAFAERMNPSYVQQQDLRNRILEAFNAMFYKGRAEDLTMTPNRHSGKPFIASSRLDFGDSIWAEEDQETLLYAGNLSTLLNLFTDLSRLPATHVPVQDLRCDFAYKLKMSFKLASPPGSHKPIILSGNEEADNRYFTYSREIEQTNDSTQIHLEFTLRNPTIKAADYSQFRTQLQAIQQRSLWQVVYTRDNHHHGQDGYRQLTQGSYRIDELLERVRHHLMRGNFDQARRLTRQAVIDYPNNGEAHYLLGIALGFLDDYPASESALSKADLLGYQP